MAAESTNDAQGSLPRSAKPTRSEGQTNENSLRVFLSYSRKDQQTAVWLREELEARGVEVFRDVDDTLPGEVWWQRLQDLIAKSDAVVFVLSSHSATSTVCGDEVIHAHNLSKRIFPVAISDVDWEAVPEHLSRVHSVSCLETDTREEAVNQLCEALATDIDWVREHTRLYERAQRWEQRDRSKHELLRGRTLNDAEVWLDTQPQNAEPPTPLHREFFQSSRHAARRRRTHLTGGLVAGILIAVTLASFAFWQRNEAIIATGKAKAAQSEAERLERLAVVAKDEAERQEGIATTARIKAEASESKTRRTMATSLFVRASRELASRNTADALACLCRAMEIDPEYRTARVRLHSILTTRRHAIPLVSFETNQANDIARPQFHPDEPHFYDCQYTWDLDSLDLVFGAVDLSWARVRTVVRASEASTVVLMPAVSLTGDPNALLLTDPSQNLNQPLLTIRHDGAVGDFEFSHAGDRIVSASADGTASIHSREAGDLIGEPMRHRQPVNSATFSPDDSRILTTSADATACIWNSETGQQIANPMVHQAPVVGGIFSRDGSRVITWTSSRIAHVWLSTKDGHELYCWFGGFEGNIVDAQLNADNSLLAIALTDGTARVFDIGNRRRLSDYCEPIPHGNSVRWVSFAPTGNQLATAGEGVTRIWQLPSSRVEDDAPERLVAANGRELEIRRDSEDGVQVIDPLTEETIATFEKLPDSLAISAGGRYLFDPFDFHVFDTTTGESTELEIGNELPLRRAAFEFSPDESRLLTLHRNDIARIWELPGGRQIEDVEIDTELKPPPGVTLPVTNRIGLKSARWNPDGSRFAIVSRRIGMHDGESGDLLFELKTGSSDRQAIGELPGCVVFAPVGDLIAGSYSTASGISAIAGRIQLWDSRTGERKGRPIRCRDAVVALAISNDATRLIAAERNGSIRVYDIATQEPQTEVVSVGGPPTSVCFSADETMLLTATDRTVQAWDVATSLPVTDPIYVGAARITSTRDSARIRVEFKDGSSRTVPVDWSPILPPEFIRQRVAFATALAGQRMATDTGIMLPADPFPALVRLHAEQADLPELSNLKFPRFQVWSPGKWITSHAQPDSLEEIQQLSFRFPRVPVAHARLAVMYAAFEGTGPEETRVSRTMAQHNAQLAGLGQRPDPRTFFYLSQYYQLTGNEVQARAMAERALQQDPSSEQFQEQLRLVDRMRAEDEHDSAEQESAP